MRPGLNELRSFGVDNLQSSVFSFVLEEELVDIHCLQLNLENTNGSEGEKRDWWGVKLESSTHSDNCVVHA